MLENLISFSISLLIGLLIGIERERSHEEGSQPIGVRTFILLSLLGTTTAVIKQPIITLTASIFAFGMILVGYFRSTVSRAKIRGIGVTTEISAAIIYCLGYITPSFPWLAITISGIVLLVLLEKKRLHTLARKKLKTHEIEAAIILTIFTIGIIPILPNKPIDEWGLFNPQKFGMLMALIASIQFGGYVVIRLFGERFGIALTGFLGGLISSTVVFANMGHLLKSHPNSLFSVIAAALLANVAMFLEIMLIVFVASHELFFYIFWPLFGMVMAGCFFSFILIYRQNIKSLETSELTNPLNLLSILRISLFIGTALIVISVTKQYFGTKAMVLAAFLGGLFEIHGISLATSLLYVENQIKLYNAGLVIYVALLGAFVSKFFLLWALTPRRFASYTTLFLMVILGCGIGIYWLTS